MLSVSAAMPLTMGAAIEVPVRVAYDWSVGRGEEGARGGGGSRSAPQCR